jgi:hypothetical protein
MDEGKEGKEGGRETDHGNCYLLEKDTGLMACGVNVFIFISMA